MRHGGVPRYRAAIPMIILDGALGTELSRRGRNLSDALSAARLVLDDPAAIESAHRDYYLAGADIATTARYQASFSGFAARGLSHAETSDAPKRSVAIARRAQACVPRESPPPLARTAPFSSTARSSATSTASRSATSRRSTGNACTSSGVPLPICSPARRSQTA